MGKYILSPQKREHPTKAELALLNRRLSHDASVEFNGIHTALYNLRRGMDISPVADRLYAKSTHVRRILLALELLGQNKRTHQQYSLNDLLEALTVDANRVGEDEGIIVENDTQETITVDNEASVVYMQLYNAVTNAFESYHGDIGEMRGGSIRVHARVHLLSEQDHGHLGPHQALYQPGERFVVVSVADQGKGIEENILPTIFRDGVTSKRKGSGIGLALSDYICDYLHGFLRVESAVGIGTTFSLFFPAGYKRDNV
ncbi:MAG: ATP-binding protein [Nanoarchaeota archaeon]